MSFKMTKKFNAKDELRMKEKNYRCCWGKTYLFCSFFLLFFLFEFHSFNFFLKIFFILLIRGYAKKIDQRNPFVGHIILLLSLSLSFLLSSRRTQTKKKSNRLFFPSVDFG